MTVPRVIGQRTTNYCEQGLNLHWDFFLFQARVVKPERLEKTQQCSSGVYIDFFQAPRKIKQQHSPVCGIKKMHLAPRKKKAILEM